MSWAIQAFSQVCSGRSPAAQFEHGVRLVCPMRPDVSLQAQADEGFDIAHFEIDWEADW